MDVPTFYDTFRPRRTADFKQAAETRLRPEGERSSARFHLCMIPFGAKINVPQACGAVYCFAASVSRTAKASTATGLPFRIFRGLMSISFTRS